MQTIKETILRVKPCGCIVKEGGIVLLCPDHAKAELSWDRDFNSHSPQNVATRLSELIPYCGSDILEVLTSLVNMAKIVLRERKRNETLLETTARIIKESKYASQPHSLIV